jgi:mRNA interferase MazF
VRDFDSWNKIKQKTDLRKNNLFIKEREIRWIRIGLNIGIESMGKGKLFSRPVLIVKKFSNSCFWGIPITTKRKVGSWYFYLRGIDRTLILNQMRVFDKNRLEEKIYTISEKELLKVQEKIIGLLKS